MRQQLDELDALLQRMLTLPINQADDQFVEPSPRRQATDPNLTLPPAPGRRPQMMLLDGSAPVAPPQSPPPAWDPHWNINLNPQQGSSILGPRSPAAQRSQSDPPPPVWRAETIAFVPARSEPTPQPPMTTAGALLARVEATSASPFLPPTEEPVAMSFSPLIALNRAFDAIMLCFGPVGQLFCTSAGRNLLGMTGLALLIGGAAWGAAGWFGWPW
jgi:hypothetical protein